ncbi:hypothetical protein HMN09_00782300 [Mycena chlorophos]|uniref:Uncharacterized protein n=1 Tax=Mycena chlorophos TaxID=658473 RepID=A0A8H6SVW6_MYCCL|nr:hypothetical protein HMN09_00782300 [Mycena chlorophos]
MTSSDEYPSGSDSDGSFDGHDDEDDQVQPEPDPCLPRRGPPGFPSWYGPTGEYYAGKHSDSKARGYSNLRNPRSFATYYDCAPYRMYFPDAEPVPRPVRHWCFLGEIVSLKGLLLQVKDLEDAIIPVGLDFKGAYGEFDLGTVRVGGTIAILYAEKTGDDLDPLMLVRYSQFVKAHISLRFEDAAPNQRQNRSRNARTSPTQMSRLRQGRRADEDNLATECQTAAWHRVHKRECKIFAAVNELKCSRDWHRTYASEWVPHGGKEKMLLESKDWLKDHDMRFLVQPQWRSAEPLEAAKLRGTFEITSSALIWGTLMSVYETLKEPETKIHRVPAMNGTWKVAEVNGSGNPKYKMDSWIVYHSSYASPAEFLALSRPYGWDRSGLKPTADPNIELWTYEDWGAASRDDVGTAKILAGFDTAQTGWSAALQRQRRLSDAGKYAQAGHPDHELWERSGRYDSHTSFFMDAEYGAALLKMLVKPSLLDENLAKKQGSTLLANESPVGCHLVLRDPDHEEGRLIYRKDASGKKELVAFWYDTCYEYDDKNAPTYEDL